MSDNNGTPCSECGEPMENSTFLSEDFNYFGGTMVFQCVCGHQINRQFTPTDLISVEEIGRIMMKDEGMSEDVIERALSHYKAKRKLKKIGENKIATN